MIYKKLVTTKVCAEFLVTKIQFECSALAKYTSFMDHKLWNDNENCSQPLVVKFSNLFLISNTAHTCVHDWNCTFGYISEYYSLWHKCSVRTNILAFECAIALIVSNFPMSMFIAKIELKRPFCANSSEYFLNEWKFKPLEFMRKSLCKASILYMI